MKYDNYNGWKNYQTWNVALWLNNDSSLYDELVAYAIRCSKKHVKPTYTGFLRRSGYANLYTGDGVSFSDHRISKKELTRDLFEGLG